MERDLISKENNSKRSIKEIDKTKIAQWIVIIVLSIIIIVMLGINKINQIRYEKYNYFYSYFMNDYYALNQEELDSLNSKDDFWINAIFNQVNENEDEMVKQYNTIRNKEEVQENEKYHKLFASNVVGEYIGDDILYLKFDAFEEDTYKDIKKIFASANSDQTLIIDLSNNIGGRIKVLDNVLSLFTEKDKIMYFIERRGKADPIIDPDDDKVSFKTIHIIVSANTSSCSEVMALSLRNNLENVKLYGELTYGKGIGVRSREYYDGTNIGFVFGKLYGPNMESYHGKGVEPDIGIEINYDENNYGNVTKEESARILDIVLNLAKQ